jgi:hypothetical protein
MRIYRGLAFLFASGIILFVALSWKPRFRHAASWPWVNDLNTPAFIEARESNRTVDGQLADVGLGVATLAFSLAAAALLGAGNRTGSTPSRKWVMVIFANVSLLVVYVGEFVALARDQVRGEFPPWADSMGIPMAALMSGWQRNAVIMTLALGVCLWNARVPAALWGRPVGWWPWITTVVIVSVAGFGVLVLAEAVRYGKAFAIPGYVALMYGLLCARAAAASRAVVPG